MYADAWLVVAGAEEENRQFTDETLLNEWLGAVEAGAESDGYRAEVYMLWHEHDPNVECECAQYVTDHKPYRTFNPNGAT